MPRSFRFIAAAAGIVAISTLLLSATIQPPFDPLRAVPQGALAVISAGDPGVLIGNSVKFLRNAGLDEPAESLEKAMAPILDPESDIGEMDERTATVLKLMDPRRRFLAAIFPGQEDPADVSILMMIPLRSDPSSVSVEELLAIINEMASGEAGDTTISILYPGYILIGAQGFDVASMSATGNLDLSGLATYPASSLAVWVDTTVGTQYLDLITDSLGSLFSGNGGDDYYDDGYFDDYDDWSGDEYAEGEMYQGPLDNVPFLLPNYDEGYYDDAYYEDDSFYYDPLDNLLIAESLGGEAYYPEEDDPEADLEGYTEEELPDDEYAEDFSWDEYADGDVPDDESDFEFEGKAENPVKGIIDTLTEKMTTGGDEIESLEVVLTVQAEQAWFRIGSDVVKGGKLAGMAGRASAGDKSIPYLSYCETDSLVSVAWSAPSDWSMPVLEDFYKLLMPEATFLDTVMASFKAYSLATGMNGATSIGVSLSEELVQAIQSGNDMEDADAMDLITRGLTLSVSGAMELTDRQSFRDTTSSMMDIVKEPDYAELMAASGLGFDVQRKIGTVRGMPYDRYTYQFTAVDAEADDADMMAGLSTLVGNLLSPVYVYKGDKAYLGLGNPESVNALIDRDGARVPLRNDKAFKALRAGAPADARAVFYLSTKELAKLFFRLMPADQAPLEFNVNGLSGMLTWLDASPGSMGFGMGTGAEDIKALVAISKK